MNEAAKNSHERLAELIASGAATPAQRETRSRPEPTQFPGGAIISDLVQDQRR
ncbi:MAG: hypothetical protein ACREN8_11150 [Candidatus Dormibacteraceae bacterium]